MIWTLWRRPFNSYVFLWMTLALLSLTVFLVGGAFQARQGDVWVNHSLEVLQNLERYEASLLAAEMQSNDNTAGVNKSAQRSLVEESLGIGRESVNRLLDLTVDNPRQAIRVRVLNSLTDQASKRIRLSWAIPALIGQPAVSIWSDLPFGSTIAEIRNEERTLLTQRQHSRSSADTSFWIFTAIALTANMIIVGWAYSASRRYIDERNRTEQEIRELNGRLAEQVSAIGGLNATLEDRVIAKTAELEATVAKLKASNQELERFAYVASHDMQEPLRQVVSFNNLLSLKYAEKLDTTAKRYLEYSVSGAKRLQLMLRGLLQYTVTSPAAVYRVEIPVDQLMRLVLQDVHAEVQAAGTVINIQAENGLLIVGDRDMIRTLVVALLSNAIKFRQTDQPSIADISFARTPSSWTVTVKDNGIGIEERFRPRLFEMFARFHPVGQYQGAGVGLALSKRIVDCHGGRFAVSAAPEGSGTVFTVEIPILSADTRNLLETGRFPY